MQKAVGCFAVKGGTGKTVVSLSLARLLARKAKVGLLDADIDNSNFAQFVKAKGGVEVTPDRRFKLYDWDGVKVFSMSLLAGRERSVSMTGDRYVQMISDVMEFGDWDCDVVVIDLPGGSSDVWKGVLTIFGQLYLGSIIVAQPNMTDATVKGVNLHKYYEVPILGVLENMSYFECEHKTRYHLFGEPKTKEVCEKLGVEYLGEIPFVPNFEIPIESEALSKVCDKVLTSEVKKTSFLKRFKEAVLEKLKEEVEALLVTLLLKVQKEMDLKKLSTDMGFTEQRPFVLSITNEAGDRVISRVPLRIKDGKLLVLKNPQKLDYEIATSLGTFSRVVLGKTSAWDAWLNGDIKVYGTGFTPRAIAVIKGIFDNEALMGEVRGKYGSLLERWAG